MNLRFFIDRPVFSGVISVVIVLMGVIAMKALPVEQSSDRQRILHISRRKCRDGAESGNRSA